MVGNRSDVPIIASDIVYEGSMVGDNESGYGRPLVAGDIFRGHCYERCDNASGSAGAKYIRVLRGTYRLVVTIASVAITDVGKDVYASDDNTYVLAQGLNTRVGRVSRYVTTNTAEVEFLTDGVGIFSARSRTALQLPTAAILANFNMADLRACAFAGSLLETDFTRPGGLPDVRFVDATYAAAAAGKTMTEGLYLGTTAIGELIAFATSDNQAVEGQWSCPIVSSGSGAWAFGARIKQSILTDSRAGHFAGLMVPSNLAGDLIVDGGTLQTEGSLGFQIKEGDGDKIDVIYDKTGQAQNEHAADWATQVADTYNVVELYYNGTTIAMYLDGVATGTAISAADIAAADFPAATIMVPTIALKNANAADFTVTWDWAYAVQAAT
jgi:hypothetical protein